LWKSLWVTLIAIGFVLVFKAQLSGAKFLRKQSPKGCKGQTFFQRGSLGEQLCVIIYLVLECKELWFWKDRDF